MAPASRSPDEAGAPVVFLAVFDGGRAAIHRAAPRARHGPRLTLVDELRDFAPPTRALGRDRPGRFFGVGGRRGSGEAPDLHARREAAFVERVAAAAEALARADAFQRLILIAPAPLAARFREAAPTASARLIAEIHGDHARDPLRALSALAAEAMRAGSRPA